MSEPFVAILLDLLLFTTPIYDFFLFSSQLLEHQTMVGILLFEDAGKMSCGSTQDFREVMSSKCGEGAAKPHLMLCTQG